ncbi:MAG: hypothetical protein M3552_06385 [Planctomycetota bacterium]|nr:hypothetical protein [Planctomycetaceae bacterium]MDQ3330263.1 hypothetical protein [Planctomycetota bacterium]
MLPWLVGDILYWFSWLVMVVGGFALVAIAYRRPDFRRSLLGSVVLLWLILGILSL